MQLSLIPFWKFSWEKCRNCTQRIWHRIAAFHFQGPSSEYQKIAEGYRFFSSISSQILKSVRGDFLQVWRIVFEFQIRPKPILPLKFLSCPSVQRFLLDLGLEFADFPRILGIGWKNQWISWFCLANHGKLRPKTRIRSRFLSFSQLRHHFLLPWLKTFLLLAISLQPWRNGCW